MVQMPLEDDSYPEPLVSRPRSPSGLWRVVALAGFFIIVAVVLSTLSSQIPPDVDAAGPRRPRRGRRLLSLRARRGSLPLLAGRGGADAVARHRRQPAVRRGGRRSRGQDLVRQRAVRRVRRRHEQRRAGRRAAALCRAARGERVGLPAVARGPRRPPGGRGHPAGRRARRHRGGLGAAPLVPRRRARAAAGRGRRRPQVLWTVEDITRDRERQDNAFVELQRAIDYLDHAPAGFFSADADGRVQYINSTLADWLGYDLAEFPSGQSGARPISCAATARAS